MQTNPETPVKDTARPGSSFTEVLASTSLQPTPVAQTPVSPVLRFASHNDSESASHQKTAPTQEAEQDSKQLQTASPAGSAGSAPAGSDHRASLAQTQASQTLSRTGIATRAASHDDRSPSSTTALAAKIAATVFLPSVALVATAGSAMAVPASQTSIAAPVTQSSSDEKQATSGLERITGVGAEVTARNSNANSATPVAMAVHLALIAGEQASPNAKSLALVSQPSDLSDSTRANETSVGVDAAEVVRGSNPKSIEVVGQPKIQTQAAKTSDSTSTPDADSTPTQEAKATVAQTGIAESALAQVLGVAPAPASTILSGLASQMVLPNSALVPAIGDAGQTTIKSAQNTKSSDSTTAGVGDASNASNAGKATATTASSSGSAGQAVQNAANGIQPAQHGQGYVAQSTSAAPKAADEAGAQVQVVAMQSAGHEIATSASKADTASSSVRTDGQEFQSQASETAASSGINTARVIQNMSDTEMHVGMHSAEFGDISIRTSVSLQQMTAQISVDHGDLGKAISAHIPAIQEKLGGETGLRATVEVNQGGMSFSEERGYSSQRESKGSGQMAHFDFNQVSPELDSSALRAAAMSGDGNRLDIRA